MMVEKHVLYVCDGPNVVKTVTNEDVTSEELGGAMTHAKKSGVAHLTAYNDLDAIRKLRNLFSYIPQNNNEKTPRLPYEWAMNVVRL